MTPAKSSAGRTEVRPGDVPLQTVDPLVRTPLAQGVPERVPGSSGTRRRGT